ncbi:MAG: hypothetical protein J7M38_09225, partial [Armatimonadetes bacterium]|nr:hypothetical protein [Armatimonadota bacterium]
QQRIDAIARLIRGYLRRLEAFAQDQLRANDALIEQARAAAQASDDDEVDVTNIPPRVKIGTSGGRLLLTSSARGRHPLSLTETLATIITAPPEAIVEAPTEAGEPIRVGYDVLVSVGHAMDAALGAAAGSGPERRQALARALEGRLETWLAELAERDPETLQAWAEMVGEDAPESDLARTLDRLLESREADEARAPDARALLPSRLLDCFADPESARTAADSVAGFLSMYSQLHSRWEDVPPEQLRKRAADAQVVLQDAEQALAEDMRALFLEPLERSLRAIVSARGQSGLGSTSRTSIAVLSGTEAHVVGSAMSYFEVTRSPEINAETLNRSEEFSRALEGIMPPASQRDPVRRVIRIELDTAKVSDEDLMQWPSRLEQIVPGLNVWPLESGGRPAMMVVGTDAAVRSALNILRSSGAVGSVQTAGSAGGELMTPGSDVLPASGGGPGAAEAAFPAGRLLGLAMALGSPDQVWTALTEGADLTFTPHILPGGSAAEVTIDFTVSHEDGGTNSDEGPPPLSRVAQHTASTSVYVRALDLFALSSFALQTSHPRPDTSIPVLGRLPLIGQIFRFPRSPATVHHESLLMVYSTILPTGADLAETLDAKDLSGD